MVLAEFRNYRASCPPAPAPGASPSFFASIDASPTAAPAAAPKTQRNDRDILNLLTKRASVLHLGGELLLVHRPVPRTVPQARRHPGGRPPAHRNVRLGPLPAGHPPPSHRPVWAEHAERTKTFIGQLGKTRTTERSRLRGDYDRAQRVIAEIDAAAPPPSKDPA